MFIIREVEETDLEGLFKLSQLENFLNLPRNKTLLSKKIKLSLQSFQNTAKFNEENSFLFVLEDTENKEIIGCSNLHSQHGTQERPHYYLSVSKETKASDSENLEFEHTALKLGVQVNGYTEIGGLVLNPKYRGNPLKLGKQISFSRFLYISLFPHLFTNEIHAELLPPFDKDGNSPLWKGLGEKFFQMDYLQADIISRKDKNFILDLFPSENIYVKLLAPEAQKAIGSIGASTIPVKKMLESIGFTYQNEIDPFDGGPHFRCKKHEITPIKHSKEIILSFVAIIPEPQNFLISPIGSSKFQAFMTKGSLRDNNLQLRLKDYPHLESYHKQEFKIIPI